MLGTRPVPAPRLRLVRRGGGASLRRCMPPARPSRPAPAQAAPPVPPPARRTPPAKGPPPARSAAGPRRGGGAQPEAAADPPTRRTEALRPARPARTLLLVMGGVAVCLALAVAIAVAWGPMQRSSQLAALDACREAGQIDEARRLGTAFANTWPGEPVRRAVADGRGPVEARIAMAATGRHLDLLAQLLETAGLSSAQRGEACAALADVWPAENGPRPPAAVAAWAVDPEAGPELHVPALRLVQCAAPEGAEAALAQAIADPRLPGPRAAAAAAALAALIDRRGEGLARLLDGLRGPHRATLLAEPAVSASVAANAMPAYTQRLLALLAEEDARLLALAGLSGPRFELPPAERAGFGATLAPFLAPQAPDAVVGAALRVVRRQRLHQALPQLLALLPRVAARAPAGWDAEQLADLYGRAMVSTQSPDAAAAAEAMVAGLAAAIPDPAAWPLAASALGRVQDGRVPGLRRALDALAVREAEPACAAALATLVRSALGRDDIVVAAKARGWARLLADDNRRYARFREMEGWIDAHKDETTVRSEKAVLLANKAELERMRTEVRGWLAGAEPAPLGLSKPRFEELEKRIEAMWSMVHKASARS